MATEKWTAFVLSLLLSCFVTCAAPLTDAFTCVAGNFTAGQTAAVTCYFNKDVNQTMHHVYVTWYSFASTEIYEDVIDCFRKRTKELVCRVKDGYEYRNVISDTLTFRIPKVTTDFAGGYSCSLVPPDGIKPNLCYLHVQNGTPSPKATRSPTPRATTKTPKPQTHTGEQTKFIALYIAVAILAVIVFVLFLQSRSKQGSICLVCGQLGDSTALARQARQDEATETSQFTPQQVMALLEDTTFRKHHFDEMLVHGRQSARSRLEKKLAEGECRACNTREGVAEVNVNSSQRDEPHREIAVDMDVAACSTDFQRWLEGLPEAALNALVKEGFDDVRALESATEEDIRDLNLKRGHEILVLREVEILQKQAGRAAQFPAKKKTRKEYDDSGAASERFELLGVSVPDSSSKAVQEDEREAEDEV